MDNNISNSEKNNLIEAVKEWIDYDMKLEILNKKVKEIKNAKAILNSQMNLIIKQHNIDILDTKNGQIQRKKIKRKEQLSQKKLLNIYFVVSIISKIKLTTQNFLYGQMISKI